MSDKMLTPLSSIGEFGLIDRLLSKFDKGTQEVIVGPGDDAGVVKLAGGLLAVSTDSYVEGVHFDLSYSPLKHLGYKVVSATLSDIYAMNGKPQYVLIAINAGAKLTVEALEELYEGIWAACTYFNVVLLGGDTTSSGGGLSITATVIGVVQENRISTRGGAKIGDTLWISGDLGGAYIGLQLLEREKRVYLAHPEAKPDLGEHTYVLSRQLRPVARKDVFETFETLGIKPTSMIDVSDGLASEALHIANASKVGILIREADIPLDDETHELAMTFNLDPTMCALNGGEDYELLFTLSPEQDALLANHPDFTCIGEVTHASEGVVLLTRSGNTHTLEAQGFKHFDEKAN